MPSVRGSTTTRAFPFLALPLVKVAAMMRIARIIAAVTGAETVADCRETRVRSKEEKQFIPNGSGRCLARKPPIACRGDRQRWWRPTPDGGASTAARPDGKPAYSLLS
jgi:hypothetical protein